MTSSRRFLPTLWFLMMIGGSQSEFDYLQEDCSTECGPKVEEPCSKEIHEGSWTDLCPFIRYEDDGAFAADNFTYTISHEYDKSQTLCSPRITLQFTLLPTSGHFEGFILTTANVDSFVDQECVFINASAANYSQEWTFDCLQLGLRGNFVFKLASQPPRNDGEHEKELRIDTRELFFTDSSHQCIFTTTTTTDITSTSMPDPTTSSSIPNSTTSSSIPPPVTSMKPESTEVAKTGSKNDGLNQSDRMVIAVVVCITAIALAIVVAIIVLCVRPCNRKDWDVSKHEDRKNSVDNGTNFRSELDMTSEDGRITIFNPPPPMSPADVNSVWFTNITEQFKDQGNNSNDSGVSSHSFNADEQVHSC